MRRIAVWIALFLSLAVLPAAAQHPNVERGFAPGQSFQIGDVDHVNLFNGSLVITLPIGPSYPAGGSLSYGLTLAYSSNVWDHRMADGGSLSRPNRFSNAGLGWRLSLGRYYAWNHADNDLEKDLYVGPDGAEHAFYNTLHAGDADDPGDGTYADQQNVLYTRDGSYLRAKKTANGWDVEFPDGQVHSFDTSGRLVQIADRSGNQVTVAYGTNLWTITDRYGRSQRIYFQSLSYGADNVEMVDRVELTAFGTATPATYDFSYTQVTISRGCPNQDALNKTVSVPLLTSVSRPDGSLWRMPTSDYITTAPETGSGCRASGVIQAMTLPTLGRLEWTWQDYKFPTGSAKAPAWRFSSGVLTRAIRNPDGTIHGVWSYQTALTPDALTGKERELVNTVTDPLGHATVSYFSVYPDEDVATGWSGYDYSLPFTRFATDGAGRFLSSRIYDASGRLLRSSYVRYEGDQRWSAAEIQDKTNLNRREASRRTVYEDDGGTYADETFSDFDGLGHYRQRQTGGNFPGANVRTSFSNHNPGRGTYNQAGFSMLPSASPWILSTPSFEWDQEGSNTLYRSSCWNATTGELLRRRAHLANGSTQGSSDVLTVYTYTAGNLTREAMYGGDTQTVGVTPAGGDFCSLALPVTPAYQIDHTYSTGARASSLWSGTTFKTLDLTIDANTGLPSASRDTAGLTTNYTYDALGRLLTVDPTDDAMTTYTYRLATSANSLARVTIARVTSPGAAALAESRIDFDGLGRPVSEEKRMPDSSWSARKTAYNALGWKTFVSEQGSSSGTQFDNFDPFGRPGKITPADGASHAVTLTYAGTRQAARAVKVSTSSTAETNATTTEVYDRHGRLYEITEPNNVKTRYEYDAANHLTKVCQKVSSTNTCGQTRLFTYDNRGFLTAETHPEKGVGGNGTVTWSSFDARGHAGRVIDGPNDLTFAYDKAERLTLVRESGSGFVDCVSNGGHKCLKTFTYATANGTGDNRKGKLQTARRYNYVGTPFNATIEVQDTYVYGGDEGRVSQKDTQMILNGTAKEGFRQSWTYDLLGNLDQQSYPDCVAVCSPASPRQVTYAYTKGWLTSVPGFASAISYHPNGLVNQVTHANGVVYTQQNDPYGIGRPAGMTSFKGTTALWQSGAYSYDGAGNVKSMGTGFSFLYDSLSRVVDARLPGGASQLYTYDDFGNLTSLTTGGTLQNTPASTTTNRLTGTTTSYDGAGNLTAWNGNTYTYDNFNQLARAKSGAEEWVYVYTADDERFWSYRVGGGGSLWSLRDLSGQVLREYQAHVSWSTFEDYVYRGDQLLAGLPSSGEQRHFDLDHLGTIRLVTDAYGNATGVHRYYPFGKEQTTLQETDRRKWAGHERDLANLSGDGDDLDYMHARHYSPVVGRFLSVDWVTGVVQDPRTWNRYAYALGNPLRNIDPDGQFSRDTLLGYMNALVSDMTFGLGRMDSESSDFQEGQRLGDAAAQKVGVALTVIGGATTTGGLVAEAPTLGGSTIVVAGGLATAGYGLAVTGTATVQLMKSNGSGSSDKFGGKTAAEVIPGRVKRSASYHSELENKTQPELEALARGSGPEAKAAKQMKKLMEQASRLLAKTKNKR